MKATLLLVLVSVLFVGSGASAGRQWYYQPVENVWGNLQMGGSTAIGMRSGYTWPVVA